MTIQQCKYVLEIAKTGSFSQAAKQLFTAQSSLSVSIKTLEGELGIRIFERTSSGVRLTEDGAEFVRYANQIVDGAELVYDRYETPTLRSRLYIATQHYDFIADLFGNFVSDTEESSYSFAIKEIETHKIIREVEMSYSDIGIIAIKDGDFEIMKRYLSNKKLFFTPLLCVPPHVFFKKDHPLSGRERLHISELCDYPYVSYEQGDHSSSFFTEEIMPSTPVRKHIEISDRATLMNLLLLTDSYTVGTGIMPSALNRGDIVSVPLDSDEYYIIGYILNGERKLSQMTSSFISLLEKIKK